MRPVNVGALILAAGFSRRLGRPKQEIVFQDETLLARAVRIANQAALHPVVAVVQDPRWMSILQPLGAIVLHNENADQGMATSVITGVTWASDKNLDGLVLMTCDQPALRPEHLHALCADPQLITGSRYAGRTGVPAYFPANTFTELLKLQGDAGARALLQHAAFIHEESLALDIDTEEDLLLAERQLAPAPSS